MSPQAARQILDCFLGAFQNWTRPVLSNLIQWWQKPILWQETCTRAPVEVFPRLHHSMTCILHCVKQKFCSPGNPIACYSRTDITLIPKPLQTYFVPNTLKTAWWNLPFPLQMSPWLESLSTCFSIGLMRNHVGVYVFVLFWGHNTFSRIPTG